MFHVQSKDAAILNVFSSRVAVESLKKEASDGMDSIKLTEEEQWGKGWREG